MIYAVFINVPEKVASMVEDVRKSIGREIADGNVVSFTEATYSGDHAFILLAKSHRAAARVYDRFKELPVHVKIVEIEGKGE